MVMLILIKDILLENMKKMIAIDKAFMNVLHSKR